ncbi:restriction endonuclease [Mycobacterium sp. KBS0706]|nr:restriction endonuclease [Mycobacterium sp. KBS0706]
MLLGALFTRDFLKQGIIETQEWRGLGASALEQFASQVRTSFKQFPTAGAPNESQTEQDLIFPILDLLGWKDRLTQIRASVKGRSDVPDMLLFENADAKGKANAESEPAYKFRHGIAICENKAWDVPLDRAGRGKLGDGVPSTQILRYLTVAEVQSDRRIQWGILTNGRHWRLYFQQARSRSEEFLDLDLAAILRVPGFSDPPAMDEDERTHWLKVFILMFRRQAFLTGADKRTFHHVALDEGRHWEERVAKDLSNLVFEQVFPTLISGIVANDPHAPKALSRTYLAEVKQAALILLYRLLFILYAEDRNLLPVRDSRYEGYAMRTGVREHIAKRMESKEVFAESLGDYYGRVQRLFRAIAKGERSLGIPPYNGGLFDGSRTPILERIELPDAVFAPVVDALSRHSQGSGKRWINYRDLSVQQLGSIYEGLLEFEPTIEGGKVAIKPNVFARRGSGSYYTPESLVSLIIERTVGPLIDERRERFSTKAAEMANSSKSNSPRLEDLTALDPASAILDLRICDPAMGSGHFLVSLVDYLADRILEAIAEAKASVPWTDYQSPLVDRIAALRDRITSQAAANAWVVEEGQLDDRLIVRRLILKRVIHGVDLNPMAVELAKVSLWLHTFTVGAPLSFLNHHLRCGNSLYGEQVRPVMDELSKRFNLLINRYVTRARKAAEGMRRIEDLSDVDIGEVQSSAAAFTQVVDDTRPLEALLDLRQALRWLGVDRLSKKRLHPAVASLFDGSLGDLLAIATGRLRLADDGAQPDLTGGQSARSTTISKAEVISAAARLVGRASEIIQEQRFLHWQVAFPDIWDNWNSINGSGGFDAVIGNPPWDRMKLQEVEWFAARRPGIALAQTAAERKKMITALFDSSDPLTKDYEHAQRTAESAARVARTQGNYPQLSGGDINIYSLFIERAQSLIRPTGMVGLIVPSGIASDLGSAGFFRSIAASGRLSALYDFFNKRSNGELHFPDVYYRFKFSIYIAGGVERHFRSSILGFHLRDVEDTFDADRCFPLTSSDFTRVNPNTGTAPIFSSARDARLNAEIYQRQSVLVDRTGAAPLKAWPLRYTTMFHMTNDSNLFRTQAQLVEEGFYRTEANTWKRGTDEYLALYEGKMVQAYDHRAAGVLVKDDNIHRPGQPLPATLGQHSDVSWSPAPQFWVPKGAINWSSDVDWAIAFKDVTSTTNARTMIAAIVPKTGAGNTLPLLMPDPLSEAEYKENASLVVANLNSFAYDYLARQKVQGQHLNWYIVEQLAVVHPNAYSITIGNRTAAEIVRREVLKLTYVSRDMVVFACDQGYNGPPFRWDEEERRHSRARLDALFFLLYGLERAAASYILDTFPIVREQDTGNYGRYYSKDLILGYMAAFAAGDSDTRIAA